MVFEFHAIIQQYVSRVHMDLKEVFYEWDTMVSADLSGMGKVSGNPVR